MTLGHFRRWMLLPIGVASLVQALYLWNIHRWTFHNGDATYYFNQAKLITQGHWFINPYLAGEKFIITPSASHPPVTTLVLVLSDLLGAQSWLAHQVVMAVIFVVTVGICGVVGRRLAGGRAGVVVALVVGIYPYLWVNPAAVLSETLVLVITALLLWAALRFWERPRLRTAGEIGVYLALAALTRSEMIILTVLIGLPLVLLVRGLSRQERLKNLAVMAGLCVVVLAPWVGRNMTAFHSPEYLSSQGGITLETANCDPTYYGGAEGWWWYPCGASVKIPAHADESDVDRAFRKASRRGHHPGAADLEPVPTGPAGPLRSPGRSTGMGLQARHVLLLPARTLRHRRSRHPAPPPCARLPPAGPGGHRDLRRRHHLRQRSLPVGGRPGRGHPGRGRARRPGRGDLGPSPPPGRPQTPRRFRVRDRGAHAAPDAVVRHSGPERRVTTSWSDRPEWHPSPRDS